jgi:uncharacterized protein
MAEIKTRVPAPDVIALSKQHGFLAKQLYVVFTSPTAGMGPVYEHMKEHLAFQVSLEKQGIMFAAGPNWTDDEQYWEGEGMFVIRAASMAEAKKICDTDPMHICGARKYRIRPWMINEGSITIRVTASDGKCEIL